MTSHDVAFGRPTAPERIPWAAHVRWTIEGDTLFVLDLRSNLYLSLPGAQLDADKSGALERQLRERGLLANAGATDASMVRAPVQFGDGFASFWLSMLWARAIMKRHALDVAAGFLQGATCATDAKAQRMLARFRNWRPLYPRDASCLFDSLALGRYLWNGSVRSDLIYGVRGGPFAAHAWLEIGGVIVNDDPEYCAGFQRMRGP